MWPRFTRDMSFHPSSVLPLRLDRPAFKQISLVKEFQNDLHLNEWLMAASGWVEETECNNQSFIAGI